MEPQHSSKEEQEEFLLPRLLYLGSLTVEATSAGQLQLYRLLRNYPPDRLHIVEANCGVSRQPYRITDVPYTELKPAFRRGWFFARNRMPKLYWWALNLHSAWQARRAARLIAPFRPDAVLTIHDGLGWFTAEKLARALRVPLHLILHDDWIRNLPMAVTLKTKFDAHFKGTYRSAASRLCISPFMEETYTARYGVHGTILYPTRNPEFGHFKSPPIRANRKTSALTVAYAGNIFHCGYGEALRNLALALRSIGGELVVFGPTESEASRNNVVGGNISIRGFVDSVDLFHFLREEAQVLFVPMTFDEEDKLNMQISFPSKLAEYTSFALPLLISGPEYCSSVRWARLYPNSAEVITEQSVAAFRPALQRLSNPDWREALGRRALELGNQLFSHESVSAVFTAALRGKRLHA